MKNWEYKQKCKIRKIQNVQKDKILNLGEIELYEKWKKQAFLKLHLSLSYLHLILSMCKLR